MSIATRVEICLTGNPFVDTGLGVIAVLGKCKNVQDLTLDTIRDVHGDGSQLATWNAHLKSFTQVFGTNNPLFQKGYGYQAGRGPSPANLAIYQATLQNFLNSIDAPSIGPRCQACGTRSSFNFASACSKAVEASGRKTNGDKWIGRDWFPLAGSLGSDAQALPSASRTVHLCAKCLFAVHYLPLGVMLLDGRLALFQSTSTEIWYELIQDIVSEYEGRIYAGSLETLGAKEGTRAVARRLLGLFNRIQISGSSQPISPGTALQVWRFANSGASPDCSVQEIPNRALTFLWKAVVNGLQHEIDNLIETEGKRELPLFRCISDQRDYPRLYPRGKTKGASPKLYALYETEVCGRSSASLSVAKKIAVEVFSEVSHNDVNRLQREEAFQDSSSRALVRKTMVRLAKKGDLTLADYVSVFPLRSAEHGFGVRFDGWNIIRYYMHHYSESESGITVSSSETESFPRQDVLNYYASAISTRHVSDLGSRRFQSLVDSDGGHGKLSAAWLRIQFLVLAETHVGFEYGAWKDLSTDTQGNQSFGELIFQMRLLWTQWLTNGTIPAASAPSFRSDPGLPITIANNLRDVFDHHIQRRGLRRFHRDVLMPLRRSEIGLSWFRQQLQAQRNSHIARPSPLSEADWDDLLVDEEGRRCAGERLFQMHLLLANLYREVSQYQ